MKSITLEEYKKRISKHPIEYQSGFVNLHTKCKHKCLECNHIWDVVPNSIMAGHGCPRCVGNEKWDTKRYNDYLSEFDDIQCLGNYVNSTTKIKHKCLKCEHIWYITPANVKRGRRCPICARNQKWDSERYNKSISGINIRSLEDYTNRDKKIKHKCLVCNHVWLATPRAIRMGSKCPQCSKPHYCDYAFYHGKPTTLYYVYIQEYDIYKIGLTTRTVDIRYRQETFNFKVIFERFFEDGGEAYKEEQRLLEEFKDYHWVPSYDSEKFGGWTECFTIDIFDQNLDQVLDQV